MGAPLVLGSGGHVLVISWAWVACSSPSGDPALPTAGHHHCPGGAAEALVQAELSVLVERPALARATLLEAQ